MKTILTSLLVVGASVGFAFCRKDHMDTPPSDVNTGTVFSIQADQSGHPLINITLIGAAAKDSFNAALPSQMLPIYGPEIQQKIMTLYPGFTTNILGQTAAQLATVYAKDVLTVSTTGTTTYYDGTNVMTGRQLGDDVVDDHFTFIYGGPDGKANPGLTSDHVDHNDKPFLTAFPYEAAPW